MQGASAGGDGCRGNSGHRRDEKGGWGGGFGGNDMHGRSRLGRAGGYEGDAGEGGEGAGVKTCVDVSDAAAAGACTDGTGKGEPGAMAEKCIGTVMSVAGATRSRACTDGAGKGQRGQESQHGLM